MKDAISSYTVWFSGNGKSASSFKALQKLCTQVQNNSKKIVSKVFVCFLSCECHFCLRENGVLDFQSISQGYTYFTKLHNSIHSYVHKKWLLSSRYHLKSLFNIILTPRVLEYVNLESNLVNMFICMYSSTS